MGLLTGLFDVVDAFKEGFKEGYSEKISEDYFDGNSEQYFQDEDVIYVNGQEVTLHDQAKKFLWEYNQYISKAEAGDAESQFAVGKCLFCYGQRFWYGLERKREAAKWLKKAAEQGVTGAYLYLGRYYTEERFEDINMREGLQYLKKAAESNEAEAFWCIGYIIEQGRGVTKDISKAVQYYAKAAALGSVDAAEHLGVMLYEGEKVKQNKAKAFPYLKMAYEHGETLFGYYLACCYMEGNGVTQSATSAVRVLQAICIRENMLHAHIKEAQDLLIYCYENGVGTSVNYTAAEQIRQIQADEDALWNKFAGNSK